jgi:hypothetical protein
MKIIQFQQLASEAFPLKPNASTIERMANSQDRNCFIAGCKAAKKLADTETQISILEENFKLIGQIKQDVERVMNAEQDIENFATIIYLMYDQVEAKIAAKIMETES